ncbi:hypothetical protein [Aurantimonas sp. A3-2-R12]|uniref:hypothetical protein n=1 Tax=Aurantimonas sp. A3-2-R12 TaxID=3114362 RepID=UPI002E1927C1|nr:hypothetical protein [Aurantimonas sp. A3-2-R12]
MTRRRLSLSVAPKSSSEMSTLMMLSPFVIGNRMMQFWMSAASPTATDRDEMSRMVGEKMQAAGESLVAMNMAAMAAVTEATLGAVTGRGSHSNHGDAILSAGLKPYAKRVRANRKRLSK